MYVLQVTDQIKDKLKRKCKHEWSRGSRNNRKYVPFLRYCNDINLHKSASSLLRGSVVSNISAVFKVDCDVEKIFRKKLV